MENQKLDCILYKYNEYNKWVMCSLRTYLIITLNNGISIRDKEFNSLICDIPKKSIKNIQILSKTVIKFITYNNLQLALEFITELSLKKILTLYNSNEISYFQQEQERPQENNFTTKSTSTIPKKFTFFDENGNFPTNFDNNELQEFFLQLLFSEGFDEFVLKTEDWLSNYTTKIDSYVSSQGITENEDDESTLEQEDIEDI